MRLLNIFAKLGFQSNLKRKTMDRYRLARQQKLIWASYLSSSSRFPSEGLHTAISSGGMWMEVLPRLWDSERESSAPSVWTSTKWVTEAGVNPLYWRMDRMKIQFWMDLRTETKKLIFEMRKREPGKDYKERCHGQSNEAAKWPVQQYVQQKWRANLHLSELEKVCREIKIWADESHRVSLSRAVT